MLKPSTVNVVKEKKASVEIAREKADEDVARFLSSGGRIQVIPQGVSGQSEKRNKHIIINARKI